MQLPEEISGGANARDVVAQRVPDASDTYCKLLSALALRIYAQHVRLELPRRASTTRLGFTAGDIATRWRGAPRETNRNLDVYDACDCHRQARTIGPRANARFNCK